MDASQCAEMLALVAQSIEASKTVIVYKRQAASFATRLLIFQTSCTNRFQQGSGSGSGERGGAGAQPPPPLVEVAVSELTAITRAQDTIEKLLHTYIEQCESTFSTDLWDWPDWELFFEKSEDVFPAVLREMVVFSGLLQLTLPLGRMKDSAWQDAVDKHLDWRSALSACEEAAGGSSSVVGFLQDHPPPRPCLRLAAPADILTLFEVDTAYADDSDEDEDEELDDDYASENEDEEEREQRKADEEEARRVRALKYRGHFTSSAVVSTLKASGGGSGRGSESESEPCPVLLKKVGASYCRGGEGAEGVGHGLLALAVTAQHLRLPPCPHLLLPLAACLEGVGVTEQDGNNQLESLQTRRQQERNQAAGISFEDNGSGSGHSSLSSFAAGFGGLVGSGQDDTTWKDHPVPRTLGLLFPLAPYGCLMTFLQRPPPGLLPKGKVGCSVSVPSHVKLSIMLDVCQGLEHLHAHGVVHGRLHSRNVLICEGFRAKLVDFGISHLISAACATGEGLSGAKKGEGFDPRWRAPEDLLRAQYSPLFPEDDQDDDHDQRGQDEDGEGGGGGGLGSLLHLGSAASQLTVLEQHSYALVTRRSDVYSFGMLMYSIAVDGNRPFYNLPWDEAVISTVRAGGRPSFPSWIDSPDDFRGLIRAAAAGEGGEEEGGAGGDDASQRPPSCLIEECWADDPSQRVSLPHAREKLEECVGSVLKQYGNVMIDLMESRAVGLAEQVTSLSAQAEAAEVKITKGRATLQDLEAQMEKLFKPVEKKAIAQKLEAAYPRLQEAVQKNEALRREAAGLAADREALLADKSTYEQDLFVRKQLLQKRDLSPVQFSREVFVKQFAEYTKPFVLKHLRAACSDTSTLSAAVATEFGGGGVPVAEDMWSLVCGGAVFGASSSYRPKISSLYGYGVRGVAGGAGGGGDAGKGRGSSSSSDKDKAVVARKLVVEVNKYCSNSEYEGEVRLQVDRRGLLAKSRQLSRSNVYFNTQPHLTLLEDNFVDIRESQFLTEGFSPLNRHKDLDKKRRQVRCAAHFLHSYDFVARDNTERMFVQDADLTRQLQFLLAARGDVRDANGMHLKTLGFDESFLAQLADPDTDTDRDTDTQRDRDGDGDSGARGSARSSPCHLAASLGHLYALKFLIDVHHAPSDAADCDPRGWSPLSLACFQGQLPVVRYLAERHRVDMERVGRDGLTPLHLAAMRGHLPVMRYLLSRLRHKGGADASSYFADKELGGSLLHWACMTSSACAVPLRCFDRVVARHIDSVLFLLAEEDMDVNMPSPVNQSTPLMWACGSAPHSLTKHRLVDTLVESGAALTMQDRAGRTCLHYAAASGDFLLLQTLVQELNMDVTQGDARNMTPEQLAGSEKCAAYLSQCRKVPPPKNLNFVPQRFLRKAKKPSASTATKTSTGGLSSGEGGGGGGAETQQQRLSHSHTERGEEPRAIGTYLMKKSPSLMKSWQKRYFVMKEGHLRYYATKEDYEAGKAPKGSMDLLQVPPDDPEAAFLAGGAAQNEIHLLIRGTGGQDTMKNDKNKNKKQDKATKDRMFVLQAPDHDTAASWLAIVKEWVLYLH